jgi:heat shock protein HtpX
MGGAFISLMVSRIVAKWSLGVRLVDSRSGGDGAWLVERVHALARQAGLRVMPEVGIYPSAEVNAFATGPTKSRSLVAVSEGLLATMRRDEIEGVLAHEVAHIKNGDMVTMTLLQGSVNAFTLFLSRTIAYLLTQNAREEDRAMYSALIVVVLDIVLSCLGFLVVCWFSRQREFRADAGASKLLGGEGKMVAALEALRRRMGADMELAPSAVPATMKVSGRPRFYGFSTHPPLEARLEALRARHA